MTKYFTFNSEAEAEEFCTRGCPIYGKDLEGNEVKDKGVTARLADWKKHPAEGLWLVKASDMPEDAKGQIQEIDDKIIYKNRDLNKIT